MTEYKEDTDPSPQRLTSSPWIMLIRLCQEVGILLLTVSASVITAA